MSHFVTKLLYCTLIQKNNTVIQNKFKKPAELDFHTLQQDNFTNLQSYLLPTYIISLLLEI